MPQPRRPSRVLLLLLLVACRDVAPDPVCPVEAGDGLADRGAAQVDAPTPGTVAVRDGSGATLSQVPVGRREPLAPGDYVLVLNGSTRAVRVERGRVTRCRAGDLVTVGPPGTSYAVLDGNGTTLARAALGQPLALLPGAFRVRVNGSAAPVEVAPAARAEVRTGTVLLAGPGAASYAVLDPAGTTLAQAPLGTALALVAGSYLVRLNGSVAPLEVRADAAAERRSGAVTVSGEPEASFAVEDTSGTTLATSALGGLLPVLPGRYVVRLAGRPVSAEVVADRATEFATGTLVVRGAGDLGHALEDEGGTTLTSVRANQPIALLPGSYVLRSGERREPIRIAAGSLLAVAR